MREGGGEEGGGGGRRLLPLHLFGSPLSIFFCGGEGRYFWDPWTSLYKLLNYSQVLIKICQSDFFASVTGGGRRGREGRAGVEGIELGNRSKSGRRTSTSTRPHGPR